MLFRVGRFVSAAAGGRRGRLTGEKPSPPDWYRCGQNKTARNPAVNRRGYARGYAQRSARVYARFALPSGKTGPTRPPKATGQTLCGGPYFHRRWHEAMYISRAQMGSGWSRTLNKSEVLRSRQQGWVEASGLLRWRRRLRMAISGGYKGPKWGL